MKCLDYRRLLLPGTGETEDMRAHRLDCVFCADLEREHAAFDAQLRDGLEIALPAGFEERLLGVVPETDEVNLPRPDRRRFVAAAAVAALASGLGLYAWWGRDDPMALACIDFVMKDEAKSIMMGAMPRAEATGRLADTLPIGRLEQIGQIRHIAPCPFGGGTAYHVILMVPQNKVTLLIMPDTTLRGRAGATLHGMYAKVVPLHKGSVGVVGESATVVDSVVAALKA